MSWVGVDSAATEHSRLFMRHSNNNVFLVVPDIRNFVPTLKPGPVTFSERYRDYYVVLCSRRQGSIS